MCVCGWEGIEVYVSVGGCQCEWVSVWVGVSAWGGGEEVYVYNALYPILKVDEVIIIIVFLYSALSTSGEDSKRSCVWKDEFSVSPFLLLMFLLMFIQIQGHIRKNTPPPPPSDSFFFFITPQKIKCHRLICLCLCPEQQSHNIASN